MKSFSNFSNTIQENVVNESKDFIEQHLANKDINSKVVGKVVKVHSSDVAAAKKHLQKTAYFDHKVVPGLNEEKIDELSKDTLSNYVHKSFRDGNDLHKKLEGATGSERDAMKDKLSKRNQGIIQAGKKLKEAEELNLEDYSLEEIEDFMMSEDFEQLDELSKATLGSYVKKASRDSATSGRLSKDFDLSAITSKSKNDKVASAELASKFRNDAHKRMRNVDKAVDKLTKEKVDELHPNQKKLDVNKDGKIDATDLKKLRKEDVDMLSFREFVEGKIDDLRDKMAAKRDVDYAKNKPSNQPKQSNSRVVQGRSYGSTPDKEDNK